MLAELEQFEVLLQGEVKFFELLCGLTSPILIRTLIQVAEHFEVCLHCVEQVHVYELANERLQSCLLLVLAVQLHNAAVLLHVKLVRFNPLVGTVHHFMGLNLHGHDDLNNLFTAQVDFQVNLLEVRRVLPDVKEAFRQVVRVLQIDWL